MIDSLPHDTDGTTGLAHEPLGALLEVTLRAGQLLLLAGADTHRVEETVQRLGMALGASAMDVYATPTGIIATAISGEHYRTRLVRAVAAGVDLARIDAINLLARRAQAEHLERAAVATELEAIAARPRLYGRWTTALTVALACACFALLFGGNWRDSLAVFGATSLASLLRQAMQRRQISVFLQVPAVSWFAASMAIFLGTVTGVPNHDIVVPSAVLLLVPGVPLITAFSDLLASDFISGVARVAQAVLIATAIAVGVALALGLARLVGLA